MIAWPKPRRDPDVVKKRIDMLLVDKGLCPTRSQAQSLIMAGKVLVNDVPVDKAGALVEEDAGVRLKDVSRFVSRGGYKLEKALSEFSIDVAGKTCLDVGISTGGFTDCLLQRGAKKIYGVDVGRAQLHWKLATDPRVASFEGENFRRFDLTRIPEPVDVAVMDASFISIKLLIPKIVALFARDPGKHVLISLIKPQFEAGREHVGKGGIVRDATVRDAVVADIAAFVTECGFTGARTIESPITGADGNVEYLLAATRSG